LITFSLANISRLGVFGSSIEPECIGWLLLVQLGLDSLINAYSGQGIKSGFVTLGCCKKEQNRFQSDFKASAIFFENVKKLL